MEGTAVWQALLSPTAWKHAGLEGTPAGLDLAGFTALLTAQQPPCTPDGPLDIHICLQLAELAVEGAIAGLRAKRDHAEDVTHQDKPT